MKARLPQGMGGGAGNMQTMIRQAQKMQEEMEKTQEELNAKEYTVSAAGGMVECQINGKREILSVSIKPEAVDPDDVERQYFCIFYAVTGIYKQMSVTYASVKFAFEIRVFFSEILI